VTLRRPNRIELDRRSKLIANVLKLFLRDADDLVINDGDRSALRVCIRIAVESDSEFQQILAQRNNVEWTDDIDYLCDSIESGVEFFSTFKALVEPVTGVKFDRPLRASSLRLLLRQHHRDFRRLCSTRAPFAERASALMRLIKVEIIFWGHLW
jgi:hypothetical protein